MDNLPPIMEMCDREISQRDKPKARHRRRKRMSNTRSHGYKLLYTHRKHGESLFGGQESDSTALSTCFAFEDESSKLGDILSLDRF